jgi:hypothetical protein
MLTQHAAELLKAIKQDQKIQLKQAVLSNPQVFIQFAAERGYQLPQDAEIDGAIEQLSEAELAAVLNPGVGTRNRIIPR